MNDTDLENLALSMAMGTFLSSTHEEKELEAILEALSNSDERVLDELKVSIWQPFEKEPYARVARYICDAVDSNLRALKIVRGAN